jgi:hypothetical protein
MHPQSPLCPNCSRPMIVARTIPGVLDQPEVNVYECSRCRVDFITEDHLNNIRNRRAISHGSAITSGAGLLTYRELDKPCVRAERENHSMMSQFACSWN